MLEDTHRNLRRFGRLPAPPAAHRPPSGGETEAGTPTKPEPPQLRRLIDVEALAELWSVSKATLYNWVFQRRIPHVKLGHALRFDVEELEEFRERCRMPVAGKR